MRHIILHILVLMMVLAATAMAEPPKLEEKLSLQFEDVPMTTVLNMMADQYGLNMVLSGDMTQNISIRLVDVTLRDALQAVLSSNGYNYYFSGDVIVVKPFEMDAVGETTVRLMTLDHITPAAAINAASDLLSPKGKIKIIENPQAAAQNAASMAPSKITIIDLPDVVEQIARLIKEIDTPEKQISIQVRMIETGVNNNSDLGFSWPTSLSARGHGIEMSSSGDSDSDESEAIGQINLPDGAWNWGTLSVGEVNLMLDYLVSKGSTKLLSDPKVTTLNNHEAEISVTTNIPIQTINRFSEGGSVQDIVSFQDEEVGISLLVTPHITRSGEILLDVNPSVSEIIGYSGTIENQKPITSERSVRTRLMVKNGETAVMGGLLKESTLEQEESVFLLGSLPILGNIFKHKSVEKSTTDLVILITPIIVND
ncbi:MAG: hypothetical protein JW763_04445 [candidate division Zixibacteria bacterium]|nr:hypothetical protein [candidate division Zixibacteria bacterium]